MNLSELKKGQLAEVVCLNDSDLATTLMEHGIVPGHQISLEMRAPFRGPLMFKAGSARVSLRIAEAQTIEIKRL